MGSIANKSKPTVLIVDDQYRSFCSLPQVISAEAFSPVWVPDEQEGLALLRQQPHKQWIIIVDLKSTGMGGGGFLHRARQIAPKAAVLVTSPLGPFLYEGGSFYEYCGPSFKQEINTILSAVTQNLRPAPKPKVPANLAASAGEDQQFSAIIGASHAIQTIFQQIRTLQDSTITVLIQGESGTGKELIARALHQTSQRRHGPFVALNCGAIPASLMESELFGHERGAFTGAINQKKGKFEIAHQGTLFLDEISELDRDLQVKLLRVLQEKEFQRVGGNATYKTGARIVAATSRDLTQAIAQGAFRADLYYRLNVFPIYLPPLRERREDIPLLLEHFFRQTVSPAHPAPPAISPEVRNALLNYSYPGNIRQLANLVERLAVTCQAGTIRLADLPKEVLEEVGHPGDSPERLKELPRDGVPLKEVERELILKTLQKTAGNKLAAARMLGITRRLLYRRLAEYKSQT
jgi:DNA-binding NtrC family response regulator